MFAPLLAGLINRFFDRLKFIVNFRVPETQDTPALRLQQLAAFFVVVLSLEMRFSVHFNDKFAFYAGEIDNV